MLVSADIGTTNLKLVTYDKDYQVVDSYSYRYESVKKTSLQYELDLDEIYQALIDHLNPLAQDLVLTTAMHSLVLLDRDFQPLTGLITWNDRRGAQVAKELNPIQRYSFYQKTGTPIHSMNPLMKLMALLPDYPQAYYIASLKDWLFNQLTGEWKIDLPSASSSGLYYLQEAKWDEAILEDLGIGLDRLPEIVPVTYKAASQLASHPDLRVTIGATDGVSSNYALSLEGAVLSLGTSHAVRVVSSDTYLDSVTMPFNYAIDGHSYLVGYPSNNGGNVVEWLTDVFRLSIDQLGVILADRQGHSPLITFIPFINGERAPIWDSEARGEWIGLDRTHTREDIIYSALCGLAFNIRYNVEGLAKAISFQDLGVVGGLTQSRSFLQFLADLLGRTLLVPLEPYSETLGTIRLAYPDHQVPLVNLEEVTPQLDFQAVYGDSYRTFQEEVRLRYVDRSDSHA